MAVHSQYTTNLYEGNSGEIERARHLSKDYIYKRQSFRTLSETVWSHTTIIFERLIAIVIHLAEKDNEFHREIDTLNLKAGAIF
jgi:hypothetical protein